MQNPCRLHSILVLNLQKVKPSWITKAIKELYTDLHSLGMLESWLFLRHDSGHKLLLLIQKKKEFFVLLSIQKKRISHTVLCVRTLITKQTGLHTETGPYEHCKNPFCHRGVLSLWLWDNDLSHSKTWGMFSGVTKSPDFKEGRHWRKRVLSSQKSAT